MAKRQSTLKIAAVVLLLLIFFILVVTSVNTKSPVCDAAGHHLGAAYSYVRTGDFRMNPSTPPLLRLLMGLPLLSLDLKIPTDHPSWEKIESSDFNYQFLFVYNKELVERIVFLSRLAMIIISTFLGFLIYYWANRLYGYKAGLGALFLYSFSPTILGNAGLAMLDTGSACFIFLAVFQLWRYFQNRNLFNLVLTGVCFGLAQSAKISSIILYPLFAVFIFFDAYVNREATRPSPAKAAVRLAAIWFIGLFILWATYFFEFKPLLQNVPDTEEKIEYIIRFSNSMPFVNSDRLSESLIHFAKDVPIPLSTYMVSLMGVVKLVAVSGQRLLFFGRETFSGSRAYYFINYLIKTPLPVLILLLFSVISVRKRSRVGLLTNLLLILPILTIFGMAVFSKLQGGLRYLLVIYPFLFVWMSDTLSYILKKRNNILKGVLFILGLWYLLSSISCYPHYLTYFNELVGGPGGFGYKISTDMDWGQDFKELKRYMDSKGIDKVTLYCFGTVEPAYYGIDYEYIKDEELDRPWPKTYYAISSRFLNRVAWTKDITPVDRVANTIFIYYIEKKE